jgi:hypothetical protein
MQGLLGDKLFADLVRDLSRQEATGGLRITRDGESIEVFFESGIPTVATCTLPDEQVECRLVRDGLVSTEQIKTAWLAARNSARTLDQVLVEDGLLSAAALTQAQMGGSRRAINLAFQWYTGDYNFDSDCCPPPSAKLIWTSAECILKGARHASGNDTVLDAIAPDHLVVAAVQKGGGSIEQTATLNSVEGYVLSCIQSPASIREASELTGLPHTETRRAVFVLILLGLLERQSQGDQVSSDQQSSFDDFNHQSARDQVDGDQSSPGQVTCQESPSDQDASEQPSEALQWCPVDYASGDHGFRNQYRSLSTLEAADDYYDGEEVSEATGEPATGVMPSEEAILISLMITRPVPSSTNYQQKRFLEEKLQEPAAAEPGPGHIVRESSAKGMAGPKAKSLTTAIQELNIRLRLAGSGAPDTRAALVEDLYEPDHVVETDHASALNHASGPEQMSAPEQLSRPEPSIDEQPILQQPLIFDEPLRIGPPPLEEAAQATDRPEPSETRPVDDGVNNDLHVSEQEELFHRTDSIPPHFETGKLEQDQDAAANQNGASLLHRDSSGDERFLKRVIAKLDSRLAVAASSDYYQLLGIDRLASNGKITEGYEEMVALYGGYQTRWPEDAELQSKATELMSRVKRAYETLGDVELRRVYDLPSAKEQPRQIARPEPTGGQTEHRPLHEKGEARGEQALGKESRDNTAIRTGGLDGTLDRKKASLPSSLQRKSKRSSASSPGAQDFKPDLRNPYEAAEEYYKRGCALYERMDLHTAVHLLKKL